MIRSMSCDRVQSSVGCRCATAWAALCVLASTSALGADLSASGFATLGYARSDQPYRYQRFIDDGGTLRRDSVAGVQLDARLGAGFGATAQVKAAASSTSDTRYQADLAWAFLSYRPNNDWLLRLGKQRIPLYLYSETVDVGATYDFARLPTEMYSITPNNDAMALTVSTVWHWGPGELTLDAYAGESSNDFRNWQRDDIPGIQTAGARFTKLSFKHGRGLVASYRLHEHAFRIGIHRAVVERRDGGPLGSTFPFVAIAPGLGYYQVDPALPGPGVPSVQSVTNTTLVLGADLALPAHFRLLAEFGRSAIPGSELAPKSTRGYVALFKRWEHWTPYASYAFLRSPRSQTDFYTALNDNVLPAFVPGAAQLTLAQRAGADQIQASRQHSWAVGTAYSFSATQKIKAEYLHTRIAEVSRLVDPLPGTTVRNARINVLSLSYSMVF